MTIDISKIRPGDRVTLVPLEVRSVQPGAIRIWFPRFGDVAFDADQIAAHHPAPREFQVGDRVRAYYRKGSVRAVDGDNIWVRWDGAESNVTYVSAVLTLVEGGE